MLYVFSVSVPAGTARASPVRQTLDLDFGVVRRVEVSFPPGAAALCHVIIKDGLHQVWPSTPGESFAWDDYTISFSEEYELFTPPYELQAEAWNEDDVYAHEIVLRFLVLRPEMPRAGNLVQQLFGSIMPGRREA